jgi:DNA-binding NtrC family response regulator
MKHTLFKFMSGSILIIENEVLVREALVDILQLVGLKTIEAQNGREAITAFHTHQDSIDLVIMDMRLPDIDGPEVLPELEAIRPDVQVIVASGEDRQKLIHLFKSHPNVSILSKPYDIDVLLKSVKQRLEV